MKSGDLRGYALRAMDGLIGKVDDFYFDDEDWRIRYLVVDTGKWLSGRKVLISPISLGHAGWMSRPASRRLDEGGRSKAAQASTRESLSHASTRRSSSSTTDIRCTGAALVCGAWVRIQAA